MYLWLRTDEGPLIGQLKNKKKKNGKALSSIRVKPLIKNGSFHSLMRQFMASLSDSILEWLGRFHSVQQRFLFGGNQFLCFQVVCLYVSKAWKYVLSRFNGCDLPGLIPSFFQRASLFRINSIFCDKIFRFHKAETERIKRGPSSYTLPTTESKRLIDQKITQEDRKIQQISRANEMLQTISVHSDPVKRLQLIAAIQV